MYQKEIHKKAVVIVLRFGIWGNFSSFLYLTNFLHYIIFLESVYFAFIIRKINYIKEQAKWAIFYFSDSAT